MLSLLAERSAGVAPAAVVALTEGWMRMMTIAKLKTATILLLVGIAALGLAEAARTGLSGRDHDAGRPPLLARADATSPAKPGPETWPAGVAVSGRVIDHLGAAVAGADVLLLGSEKLTVYANPGPEEGQVRYSISTQPAGPPPSVKTDSGGRFSLRRPGSPADRIAVVSERMLLWEVTRKDVPDANGLVITLPEPVALTIHSRFPRSRRSRNSGSSGDRSTGSTGSRIPSSTGKSRCRTPASASSSRCRPPSTPSSESTSRRRGAGET
ncbi:MAG: hypothetical protein WKF75_09860 [Singulisphaera sp.]